MPPSRSPARIPMALGLLLFSLIGYPHSAIAADRPNILWITSEDNGPHLGCYGDDYADSPHIDQLAATGLLYLNAWSTAPVCAPARTTLISGMYPTSTGAQHMRSMTRLPGAFKMYPATLRAAGYYCTNNSKEDYNLEKVGEVWHESSRKAHWRNREKNQPFFAVFNHTISHESKLRTRPYTLKKDPARVRVPAYHPDTPEVRLDWAQYYDRITEMDALVGKTVAELKAGGLAEDTIIFYYGDHGSGMPRNKRWPYNSGLRVPLIVHIPEKFKHLAPDGYQPGGKTDRLVGFIDFPATLLSLAGIKPPDHYQGFAFAGKFAAPEQPYIYGFRGRMDERYDLVRTVRNKRYIYIRNYNPHKIYGQYIQYMFQTPTTRTWKQMFDDGKLNPAQQTFWQTKAPEELYDLESDPDEVNNLADSEAHQAVKAELRQAQRDLALRICDLGFLPESQIHARAGDLSPHEMGSDPKQYPVKRILQAAEIASMINEDPGNQLENAMQDDDSAVRYWGVMGHLMRGKKAVRNNQISLKSMLNDKAPTVQIAAAEALGRFGTEDALQSALAVLKKYASTDNGDFWLAMQALNAIDHMDEQAKTLADYLPTIPKKDPRAKRGGAYIPNLVKKTLADLR